MRCMIIVMAGRAVGFVCVTALIVVAGCSGGRGLEELKRAIADKDDGEIVGALAQLKEAEGVDEEGLEEMLLDLRHSEDWQVRDYCYVVGFARRLPAFVKLHDEFVSSDDVGERIIVAFHPMSVEDSLLMLDDKDEVVRVEAMMGAYSLRGVDVEPIIRVGLRSDHTMIQHDAIRLAAHRRIKSVAPEVVALLLQKHKKGVSYELVEEMAVNYVRLLKLEEHYDEIKPFAAAMDKRRDSTGAVSRDGPADFGLPPFPPEMVGPTSKE